MSIVQDEITNVRTPAIATTSSDFVDGTEGEEVAVIETIATGDFGADTSDNWDILVAAVIDLQQKYNSLVVAYNATIPTNTALLTALESQKIIAPI